MCLRGWHLWTRRKEVYCQLYHQVLVFRLAIATCWNKHCNVCGRHHVTWNMCNHCIEACGRFNIYLFILHVHTWFKNRNLELSPPNSSAAVSTWNTAINVDEDLQVASGAMPTVRTCEKDEENDHIQIHWSLCTKLRWPRVVESGFIDQATNDPKRSPQSSSHRYDSSETTLYNAQQYLLICHLPGIYM